MRFPGLFAELRARADRLVVGFAAAGGKDDFSRLGVYDRGDVFPRLLQDLLGLLAEGIEA